MTQHKDQMRAEFEAWARSFGTWDVQRDDEPNFRVESYTEMEVSIAWHAWQAARASAPQGVPEGFVNVPFEPTKEMLAASSLHLRRYEDDKYLAKGVAICIYKDMLAAAPQHPGNKFNNLSDID